MQCEAQGPPWHPQPKALRALRLQRLRPCQKRGGSAGNSNRVPRQTAVYHKSSCRAHWLSMQPQSNQTAVKPNSAGPKECLGTRKKCTLSPKQGVPWSPSIHLCPKGLEFLVLQQFLAGLHGAQLAVTIVHGFIRDTGVLLPHLPLHIVLLHVIDAPVAP